jgi:hypothetical protein
MTGIYWFIRIESPQNSRNLFLRLCQVEKKSGVDENERDSNLEPQMTAVLGEPFKCGFGYLDNCQFLA